MKDTKLFRTPLFLDSRSYQHLIFYMTGLLKSVLEGSFKDMKNYRCDEEWIQNGAPMQEI